MRPVVSTHIEVYVFRRRGRRIEFLTLRRAPRERVLPGVWQPVTGRIARGEGPLASARREVTEETGLSPGRWWGLTTVTVHYDAGSDRVLALPLFAAEVEEGAAVKLSAEHDAFAFLGARAAGDRFLWDTQRHALAAVRREVLRGGPQARARAIAPAPRR